MKNSQKLVILILLALGVVGAVWVARGRMATERANKTVAVCLDDAELRQLAALTGQTPEQLCKVFKSLGVTHVAVSEKILGEALQTGQMRVTPGAPGRVLLRYDDLDISPRIGEGFAKVPGVKCYGPRAVQIVPGKPLPNWKPYVDAPAIVANMGTLGLGYDETTLATIRQAGLRVIARPTPDYLYTPQAVAISLLTAKKAGAEAVIFNGVSVAGGTPLAKSTAAELDRLGLKYGFIELVPQEGNAKLASALKYRIIRTHSVSQEEMAKMSPQRGLDRFLLAATERNVRLCYVRLFVSPQADLMATNTDYIRAITTGLRKNGLQLGSPTFFQSFSVGKKALILLSLGVLGGLLWLLQLLFKMSPRWFWGLVIVGGLVSLGGSVAAFGLLRAFVALLAAIVFPTLAILAVCDAASPRDDSNKHPGLGAIGLTIRAAAITAIGGLLVAGTLSSLDYMMQIAQFRGVKLAQLLPLLLVATVTLSRSMPAYRASGQGGWVALRAGLQEAAGSVVRYWHAIAVFVALGAVAFMLMRSGNESGVEVSGLEMKLRAVLDQILLVRPRTKEILIGYPALLLGLSLLLHKRPRTAWVWLTLGAIGQLSLLNTFCHLHTPLPVSLLRIFNGLWVGLLVGLVWWLVKLVGEKILQRLWWQESP